jgi:DNA polymerase-1
MLEAFAQGLDIHTATAAKVYGVPLAEVDATQRRNAKAVNFGIIYGQSAFGLSQNLGIPRKEAAEIIDNYFQQYPGVKRYMQDTMIFAREHGYVQTIMGRRRYLPDLMHDNRQRREIAERMALNAPIQGSAADIIKQAMLNVERALISENLKSRLLLQVHDELILEVIAGEEEVLTNLVRREMGSAFPLRAPLDVSVGIGKSWNEAAH